MATDKVNIEFMENSNKAKYQKIIHEPTRFLRATVRKLVPESVRPNISTITKYLCIGLAIRFSGFLLFLGASSLKHIYFGNLPISDFIKVLKSQRLEVADK
jgi:hypothetical protein